MNTNPHPEELINARRRLLDELLRERFGDPGWLELERPRGYRGRRRRGRR